MLRLIHIVYPITIAIGRRSFDIVIPHNINLSISFRTYYFYRISRFCTTLLPAKMCSFYSLSIIKFNCKMIKCITYSIPGSGLSSTTRTYRKGKLISHDPIHIIYRVNRLFYNHIGSIPLKIIPILQLVSHLGPALLPLFISQLTAITKSGNGFNRTDISLMYTGYNFAVGHRVAKAKTRHQINSFGFRYSYTIHHFFQPRYIYCYRFLTKYMLPRQNGILQMLRPKIWGTTEQDYIYSRIDNSLIGVKTYKLAF